MSLIIIHPTFKNLTPSWVCCRFISNDLKYTNSVSLGYYIRAFMLEDEKYARIQ